jgi:hypothetical protein
MNTYRVFYKGQFLRHFHNRDEALDHIVTLCAVSSDSFGDYEILDNSDFL